MVEKDTSTANIFNEGFLVRLQAGSGILFLFFVILHLFNTMLAAKGVEAYNSFQRALRPIYQFPLVELSFIFLPLIVHIFAAILLWWKRRHKPALHASEGWRAKLHRYSGYVLLLIIFGHISAVRIPSFFFGVFPEFEGVSFSFWWYPWIFYPYYILFAMAALYHATHGLFRGLKILRPRWKLQLSPGLFKGIILAGSLLLILGILGLSGRLYKIPDPTNNDYARFYQRYLHIVLQ